MKDQMKKKEIKHLHKWNEDVCDCPFCEAPHKSCCECGEIKILK